MAEKLAKPSREQRPQLSAVESALNDLWLKVSSEEKMTNQKLEKKLGLLHRILQCIKESNGTAHKPKDKN